MVSPTNNRTHFRCAYAQSTCSSPLLYLTRTFQHYSRAYVYTICKNLKNLVLFPSSRIAFVLFTWLDSSFSPLSVSLRRLRGRGGGIIFAIFASIKDEKSNAARAVREDWKSCLLNIFFVNL